MPYILWLEWRNFYCDEDLLDPQIVVRDEHVLDANSVARGRGIQPGFTLSQARSILPGILTKQWAEGEYEPKQRAWLNECTPYTGRIEPLQDHIAALDLTLLPQAEQAAEDLIEHLLRRFKSPMRYGAGPSKWVASIASHHLELYQASANPQRFLAPLSLDNLEVIPIEHRERLNLLGYFQIGQITTLPPAVLKRQFGEGGDLILRAARGQVSDPVRAIYPPDRLMDAFRFESPVAEREALDFALKHLAEHLAPRLNGRQAARARLVLEDENEDTLTAKRTFPRPIHDYAGLRSALRILCEQIVARIQDPLVGVRVMLTELEPYRPLQSDLFMPMKRLTPEPAMAALEQVFGQGAVMTGAAMPVPRRRRVLKEWKDATGWS
ncbi:MAG: hypothetical protein KF812_00230 [Fimbriimonadaceae bacterium]|nr:hypothetical protein [Fimbriimonadaceae bacterium]